VANRCKKNERALMIVTASALAICLICFDAICQSAAPSDVGDLIRSLEQRKSVLQFFLLFPHACALVA
jgi:hypothetical protein